MNKIAATIPPLVVQSTRVLEGIKTLGPSVKLKANDVATFSTDHFDLVGGAADGTATPPIDAIFGKQPAYMEAKANHARARAELRLAIKDGYDFTAKTVNTLKDVLGRRWNSQWSALGFTNGSLELPRNPLPSLGWIEAYLRTHTTHEVPALNLTAVHAASLKTAITEAQIRPAKASSL